MARRKRRGGGGGGGDNKITILAGIQGKRDNCKISVAIRRGKLGLPNQSVMFRFGTPDNSLGPWLMDPANPANRFTLNTNAEGEAESIAFNLTGGELDLCSQVLVVYRRNTPPGEGVYEQVAHIPPAETTEHTKVTKPKGKRLKLEIPEGGLSSRNNVYQLPPLFSFGNDGKRAAEDLVFTANHPFTLLERSSNRPLFHNHRKAAKVTVFEYKTPPMGFVLLDCQLNGPEGCELTILHPESGENVTVGMTFQY